VAVQAAHQLFKRPHKKSHPLAQATAFTLEYDGLELSQATQS
jgi:hypothetical protein